MIFIGCRDCLTGFSDGSLKPVLDSVFPIEVSLEKFSSNSSPKFFFFKFSYGVLFLQEIGEAHKKMEANTNIGKIVLKM